MHQQYIFFLFICTYMFRLVHLTIVRVLNIKDYSGL